MAQTVLSLAFVLAVGGAKAADDVSRADLEKLQGEWVMVSAQRDGKEMPAEEAAKMLRVVKGDGYVLTRDDKVVAKGTIKLDASKTPRAIDVTRSEGDGAGKSALGIYEVDGDMQKVCLAQPGKDRPTEFSAKEGSGHTLAVWKRKK